MVRWLPAWIVGILFLSLLILYTLMGCVPMYLAGFSGMLFPGTAYKCWTKKIIKWVATTWIRANRLQMQFWHDTTFIADLPQTITPDGQYIAIANHQSWVDIFVVQNTLVDCAPMIKFFLKEELRYLPGVGQAALFLDMPFMKRHSKRDLIKNPKNRRQDFETTRRAVSSYLDIPLTLLNFAEGTRFTPKKKTYSQSPYNHLLPPKVGGIALAMGIFDGRVKTLLDATIVYPNGIGSFWSFMCGKLKTVHLEILERPIPEVFQSKDYNSDANFRTTFQSWIRDIWSEKDARIQEIKDLYAHL
jgi:1-acyl-sn-glycerol-3-phosphate acyltransferase